MKIAFWSNVHGQTSTTSNLVAISLMTALEYRLKVLVTHNHFEKSTLESSLLEKRYLESEQFDLFESGIDALARFIKSNKLDKDTISNYTTSILNKKLDLLMGTSHTNKELYIDDLNKVTNQVINMAGSFYDVVFIDVSSGKNEFSKKTLQEADIIVFSLSQNINVIDDFFDNYKEEIEKCVFLIGKYDKNSRYNKKNIMRKYKIKRNICTVPYNIEFSDACSDGRAVDFFLKNRNCKKDDPNYYFLEEVRNSVKVILSKAEVDIKTLQINE